MLPEITAKQKKLRPATNVGKVSVGENLVTSQNTDEQPI